MANLLDTFTSAAHSLNTYQSAMSVVANNTTNATTVGYADQSAVFTADSFTPSVGGGGVSLNKVFSSRDPYAEQSVFSAQSSSSLSSTLANTLGNVEGVFPLPSAVTPTSGGVAGMLNQFFASVASLTTSPNNTADRQAVINAGDNLSRAFNEAYTGLTNVQSNTANQAKYSVGQINALVSQIQQINSTKQRNASANSDPGLDAQLHASLESLSKLANITTQTANDGTTSVFLNGGTPLLMGVQQFSLTGNMVSGAFKVTDPNNNDVTSYAAAGGSLGGQIKLVNSTLPGYTAQLNTLAKSFADAVNTQLASGVDQNGTAGAALFTYNPLSPAKTLSITAITPDQLAAASTSGPGGNGNITVLSNMGSASQTALGGFTFTGYYGNLSSVVGTDSANAQNNMNTTSLVLAQAKTLRSNISGVSLDQEATRLTQYQQAYQATGKLIGVVNNMVQSILNLIPAN